MLSFALMLFLFCAWAILSPAGILDLQPRLFFTATGIVFSNITVRCSRFYSSFHSVWALWCAREPIKGSFFQFNKALFQEGSKPWVMLQEQNHDVRTQENVAGPCPRDMWLLQQHLPSCVPFSTLFKWRFVLATCRKTLVVSFQYFNLIKH